MISSADQELGGEKVPLLRDEGASVAHGDMTLGRHRMLGFIDTDGLRGPRNIRAEGAGFLVPLGDRHQRFLPITAPGGRGGEDHFRRLPLARPAVHIPETARQQHEAQG